MSRDKASRCPKKWSIRGSYQSMKTDADTSFATNPLTGYLVKNFQKMASVCDFVIGQSEIDTKVDLYLNGF